MWIGRGEEEVEVDLDMASKRDAEQLRHGTIKCFS